MAERLIAPALKTGKFLRVSRFHSHRHIQIKNGLAYSIKNGFGMFRSTLSTLNVADFTILFLGS
jgi:hypothetical protein